MKKGITAVFLLSVFFIYLSLVGEEIQFPFPMNRDIRSDTAALKEKLPGKVIHWPWEPKKEDELYLKYVLELESRLSQKVLGQPDAVKRVADAIIRFAAGVNDPRQPVASLLFIGPTGVGKTELAKQLCEEIYRGGEKSLIQLSMAEFSEQHTISRLLGSPPGYVDSDKGGQLTGPLSSNPFRVVLLDEIDKAHPKILKFFLQALDEGVIQSAMGDKIDCHNTVFILTTNFVGIEVLQMFESGMAENDILNTVQPYLMTVLSPELYNRLDPVIFRGLTLEVLENIVSKMLKELEQRVMRAKGIQLVFDPSLLEYLTTHGYQPELGARPLRRMIERDLTTTIAKAIMQGDYSKGNRILISYHDGMITFKKVWHL